LSDVSLSSPPSDAPRRKPADPANPWLTTAQRFLLEIDGVPIGTFTEVTGLTVDVEVEKIREGGQNQFVHQLPGRMIWPNIVLKRGIVDDDNLFDWFSKSSGDGFAAERNSLSMLHGAITLTTNHGERLRAWSIDRAFPVRWVGPVFAVESAEVPTEELELAHHGFRPRAI
jgi:phage tail-like protein